LRPRSGCAEGYRLLAGRQLGVPVTEPRDLLDRRGIDRSGIDQRDADRTEADQYGTPVPQPGPPIGGLSTGRGLSRWPSSAAGDAEDPDPLGGSAIPGHLVDLLRRRAGAGRPLTEDLQRAGGQALGRDLSGVRIHADAEAARLADSVQASAFSYGQDIYFAAGGYRPDDTAGRQLIAHELGHVGQDAGSGGVIGPADDPAEARADQAAAGVLGALRRQAENVAAIRRSPALAMPAVAEPAGAVIRRGKRKNPPQKGGGKQGGGKKSKSTPAPPPPPPPAIGQVAAPLLAPPTRSFQSDGQRADPGHNWWFKRGKKKHRRRWMPARDAPSAVPTPRSTGLTQPTESLAGSFIVKRNWDKLSAGPGFIVQEITRTFNVEVLHGGGWQAATAGVLQAYMDPARYADLYFTLDKYWEIFEVDADGDPLHNDTFQLTPISGRTSVGYADTSRGTFTQVGVAYFVPTTDSLATFAAHFGMTAGAVAAANGLHSRSGAYGFVAAAGALYPVSQPSTFTVLVTWDTDSTKPSPSQNVSLRITES
jgi:hypothetical protein